MGENIIKQTCKELGITQKELAEKIGVAEQTIYNWNANDQVPEWGIRSLGMLRILKEKQEIADAAQRLFDLLNKEK
ncbi:MAG: helix-turn-helix domain-containing protein [Helicobacteraceae bacterium]|jgi:DNA-binding XRE family transcriptional regulator|nr:helix-turn-helix domain-containing protein [Helicobacteraceae bacterium]